MAYTLANLQSDIRGYTEVSDTVLTDAVLATQIKNAENAILRAVPTDQNAHYATSTLIVGNRYVTIPQDLRSINYVQLKDTAGNQFFLEQRDPSFMAEYYSTPDTSAVDIPKYYGNWDEEFWVVAPTPDQTYAIILPRAIRKCSYNVRNWTNRLQTQRRIWRWHGSSTIKI